MSYKIGTYITLLLFIALGIGYGFSAMNFKESFAAANTLGPGAYPKGLAAVLIILCVISFIQTLRKKEDEKIEFPDFKYVAITVIVTALFVASWYFVGYVYVNVFLYLLVLLTIYRFKELNKAAWVRNIVTSLGIAVALYLLFDVVMNLNL